MARSIRASGGRPGDRVHVAYGYGLFTGGLGAHYGAEELGCAVIPVSGGMTERQGLLIRDFEPDVIMVTPSYMLALVEYRRALALVQDHSTVYHELGQTFQKQAPLSLDVNVPRLADLHLDNPQLQFQSTVSGGLVFGVFGDGW